MGAALADHEARERGAAAGAGLAIPPEHAEFIGVAAAAPGDTVEVGFAIAEGGAAVIDGALENGADRGVEPPDFSGCQRVGATPRMEARVPQRLVDVDVAESRDHGLIEQQRLEQPLPAAKARAQRLEREGRIERFGSERSERIGRAVRHEPQASELARVVEDEPTAVGKIDNHVVVGAGAFAWLREAEFAGHAQMDQQAAARVQFGHDVLGAAREPRDRAAGQSAGERFGRAANGTRPANGDGADDRPFETVGAQVAHDGFDFWQFGHVAVP